jgi:hypothetical protein
MAVSAQASGTQSGPTNPLPASLGSREAVVAAANNGFAMQQQGHSAGSGIRIALAKSNSGSASGGLNSIVVVKSADSSFGLHQAPCAQGALIPPALAMPDLQPLVAADKPQQQDGFNHARHTDGSMGGPVQQQLQQEEGPVGEASPSLASGFVCHNISELSLPSYHEQQVVGSQNARSSSSRGGNSRARVKGSPAEAQTWLIQEYCDGGTLLDMVSDGQMHDTWGKPCMVGAAGDTRRASLLLRRVVVLVVLCCIVSRPVAITSAGLGPPFDGCLERWTAAPGGGCLCSLFC